MRETQNRARWLPTRVRACVRACVRVSRGSLVLWRSPAEGESELNEREVGERERKGREGRSREGSAGRRKAGVDRDGRRRSLRVKEGKGEEWFTCIASIAPAQGQRVCETEDQTGVGTSFLPVSCTLHSLHLLASFFLLRGHHPPPPAFSFFVP